MYQRGDRVIVQGLGGRTAILRVWEDRGSGVVVSSDDGYRRLMAGDDTAPQVGFPAADVRVLTAVPAIALEQPSGRLPGVPQD